MGLRRKFVGHKEKSEVEENRDNKEGSKDSPRESQEGRTPLSVFC